MRMIFRPIIRPIPLPDDPKGSLGDLIDIIKYIIR